MSLFDHLVGAGKYYRRNCEAQCLSGFKIDHQLVLGRRLHRQVGGFLALEDTIDIACRLPVLVDEVSPIRNKPAVGDEPALEIDRGEFVSGRERDDQTAMKHRQCAPSYDQAANCGSL